MEPAGTLQSDPRLTRSRKVRIGLSGLGGDGCACPLDRPGDGAAGDEEQRRELGAGVGAGVAQRDEVGFLARAERETEWFFDEELVQAGVVDDDMLSDLGDPTVAVLAEVEALIAKWIRSLTEVTLLTRPA